MSVSDTITAALAFVGVLLGVRSEWRAHRSGRVQLRVTPMLSYPFNLPMLPAPGICIQVANLGSFAVTIDRIGFVNERKEDDFTIVSPIRVDGGPWPRRLEPHESVKLYALADERFLSSLPSIKAAFAETSTNVLVSGTSKAFKRLRRLGRIPPLGRRIVSQISGTIDVSK